MSEKSLVMDKCDKFNDEEYFEQKFSDIGIEDEIILQEIFALVNKQLEESSFDFYESKLEVRYRKAIENACRRVYSEEFTYGSPNFYFEALGGMLLFNHRGMIEYALKAKTSDDIFSFNRTYLYRKCLIEKRDDVLVFDLRRICGDISIDALSMVSEIWTYGTVRRTDTFERMRSGLYGLERYFGDIQKQIAMTAMLGGFDIGVACSVKEHPGMIGCDDTAALIVSLSGRTRIVSKLKWLSYRLKPLSYIYTLIKGHSKEDILSFLKSYEQNFIGDVVYEVVRVARGISEKSGLNGVEYMYIDKDDERRFKLSSKGRWTVDYKFKGEDTEVIVSYNE